MRFPTIGAQAASGYPIQSSSRRAGAKPRGRLLVILLGAALLIGTNLALAAPVAAAYTPDPNEVRLADMINDYRQSRGLKRIWLSPGVSDWANWRSADMCNRQYFSHTIPAYGSWPGGGNLLDFWKRYKSYYRTTYRFSELIARNGGSGDWVQGLFDQWRASSLHNSMMLSYSGKYDRFGVGTYRCPNGRKYGTIVLINLP